MNRILDQMFFILKKYAVVHQKGYSIFHIQLKGDMLSGVLGGWRNGIRASFPN